MNAKAIRLLIFSILSITSFSLKGMVFNPLHTIERMLVMKEIKTRGIDAVRQDVYNAKDVQEINDGLRCGFTTSTVLCIDEVFEQKDAATDKLTSNIFKEIQEIELKRGYIPEPIKTVNFSTYHVVCATNRIGSSTRYYWLEEGGQRLPAVKIQARLINKPELKEIVDKYTE